MSDFHFLNSLNSVMMISIRMEGSRLREKAFACLKLLVGDILTSGTAVEYLGQVMHLDIMMQYVSCIHL